VPCNPIQLGALFFILDRKSEEAAPESGFFA
jgi:hypothetical protein